MSYVYVAESGDGYCKIGRSINPELRLSQLENEFPFGFTSFLSVKVDNPDYAEAEAHKILKSKNLFREFFSVGFDDAVKIVESLKFSAPSDGECAIRGTRRAPAKKQLPVGLTESQHKYLESTGIGKAEYLRNLLVIDMGNKKNEL